MAFAIEAEIADPQAETLTFTALETMQAESASAQASRALRPG